jgi:hypothetical protein
MTDKLYGFRSNKAIESGCPTHWYTSKDGVEVEVTCVDRDPEGNVYWWPDKECVGEVIRWIRQGQPGPRSFAGPQIERYFADAEPRLRFTKCSTDSPTA